MNSAIQIVTIVFRFGAVCLLLRLAYLWLSFLLTPMLDPAFSDSMDRLQQMRWEGMFRSTAVMAIAAVALYLVAPFLSRLVTRGNER